MKYFELIYAPFQINSFSHMGFMCPNLINTLLKKNTLLTYISEVKGTQRIHV